MKISVHIRKILLLAAITLPLAISLHAQPAPPTVGPRPPKAGDEKIVRSSDKGYLRVFTPEEKIYEPGDSLTEAWINGNYRVRSESSGKARTWFHRRPLALDAGNYVIQVRDERYEEQIRVSIKPGQITSVWLNDSDRPKFTASDRSSLVRDAYGDFIGYRIR